MTLQTSPVLSTPHFILLHAGCFTVLVQRQRLETTGKTVALAFPGRNPITAEKKHVPTVTLSMDRWKYSRDIYSKTGVYLTSSARISSGVWCQPGLLVIWLYVCCPPSCLLVCLPVTEHLIAAVMYPHYVPIPWPSHLASMAFSGGNWVLGLPRLLSLSLSLSLSTSFSLHPLSFSFWIAELSRWSAQLQKMATEVMTLIYFSVSNHHNTICRTNTLQGC